MIEAEYCLWYASFIRDSHLVAFSIGYVLKSLTNWQSMNSLICMNEPGDACSRQSLFFFIHWNKHVLLQRISLQHGIHQKNSSCSRQLWYWKIQASRRAMQSTHWSSYQCRCSTSKYISKYNNEKWKRAYMIFLYVKKVYKGLDIITNKMPMDEREGIKHHLMDFLEPEEEYKVTSFLRDASQKVRLLRTPWKWCMLMWRLH